MKVAVYGLWHLGCVTAACLANLNYEVIAIDDNPEIVHALNEAKTPIYEPQLQELLIENIKNKRC